jgi:hypothetical protein
MTNLEITPAEYRYFLVDLLTNQTISVIPFTDVSYERALSKAGAFSGSIPVIDATNAYDLYESTMPGKSCVFVLRNGVCVWGGIIWSRQYSPANKKLTIDASEFVSYLYHRVVWQTLYYGSENIFCPRYQASAGTATVYTEVEHGFAVGDVVRIRNLNSALNGDVTLTATPSNVSFQFASGATLALSESRVGIARTVVNSYDVTREILGQLLNDFSQTGFVNDDITPANEAEYSIVSKKIQPVSGSSPAESLVTLETSEVHDFVEGQEIQIKDVDGNCDGFHVINSIPTAKTFTYLIEGTITTNITTLSGLTVANVVSSSIKTNAVTIVNKQVTNTIATITTSSPHQLNIGDYVGISSLANVVSYTVSTTGTEGSNIVTVASASNLSPGMLMSAINTVSGTRITSIEGTSVTLDNSLNGALSGNATFYLSAVMNGTFIVTNVPSSTQFNYIINIPDVPSTVVSDSNSKATRKTAILATDAAHGLIAGDSFIIENVGYDYDGTYLVSSTPSSKIVEYNIFATLNAITEAVFGGIIKHGPRAVVGTYGAYSSNADFNISIDNSTTSNIIGDDQQVFRGSELQTFGEVLENFAKDNEGYEYRIDCDFQNGQFVKTFTFVPFLPPPIKINIVKKQLTSNIATLTTGIAHGLLAGDEVVVTDVGIAFDGTVEVVSAPTPTTFTYYSYGYNDVPETTASGYGADRYGYDSYGGELLSGYIGVVHPVSFLGADQIVFEYPGNIIDFSFTENSENSATRMWVGGNADGLSGDVSQPYAAATATDLLAQGWPLLDQVEERNDVSTVAVGESALYHYAEDFLSESRPPEATFSISVNGSLDPQVGDYLPGDWCSIIIDDNFVRARLESDLEPRGTIIVRKIIGIKVSVPDSPTFPEKVDLDLVSEWKEDRKNA